MVSPTFTRMTGPGTVPPNVQTSWRMPGATVISFSIITSWMSWTSPARSGRRGRVVDDRSGRIGIGLDARVGRRATVRSGSWLAAARGRGEPRRTR